MIVCLLKNDYISSVELPEKIQGQFWLKDASDVNRENVIAIEGIGDQWVLKANEKVEFKDGVKFKYLKSGIIYRLKSIENKYIYVYIEEESLQGRFIKYRLKFNEGVITLGRNVNNSIVINNPAISNHHLRIFYKNNQWHLKDMNSTNGTFVNYYKVSECPLKIGDLIYVSGVKLIIGDRFVCINKSASVSLSQSDFEIMTFKTYASSEENIQRQDDYFYRSPRIKQDIQRKTIELDLPPDNQLEEEMPFILTIGPSITMGVTSLSIGMFSISTAISTGNFTSAIPSVIMSLSMLLGTVMWPLLIKRYDKKRQIERENKRQDKYGKYLDNKEKDIKEIAYEQMKIWNKNYPSIDKCKQYIYEQDSKLFERNYLHNDFLNLRVGLGKREVLLDLKYSKKGFSIVEDPLKERLYHLCEMQKIIDNVPITVSLLKHNVLGIIGDNQAIQKLLKNLLVQIFTFYGYDEVKLVFIYNENMHIYDSLRWVPYVFDNKHNKRFIMRNRNEIKEMSSYFDRIINYRKKLSEEDLTEEMPYYLIFNLDSGLANQVEFVKTISKLKKNIYFSVINVCENLKDLPSECKTVIEINGRSGNYYDLTDMSGNKTFFVPDQDDVDIEDVCKRIANIFLDISKEDNSLPALITFLQMYNVGKVEHLNALTRWKENDPALSLEVPVGINSQGELFKIDIHEKYHGPHGLVAGMTGSGKSEFIISYILSLAVNFHPYEVSFILIDYKGGGMAKAFEQLPHVAGIITNLDGTLVNRSLISIQSELKRRQSIFIKTSKILGQSHMDIYKYQTLYRQKKVEEPLPHLLIISDEFAELKTQQPDFMEQLISTARIGRSLGIHLILATQKPAGVVDDQIWSNSRFRICLKVQEKSDSIDMLKRPEAAELSQTGRFYMQVGYNEFFELGQSAWSGAKYYASETPIFEKDDSVDLIDMNGHVVRSIKLEKRLVQSNHKQLDEITKYLKHIADEEKIQIKPLWLPPLAKDIYLDEFQYKYDNMKKRAYIIEPFIGEFDNPKKQIQGILKIPISKKGNVILYGTAGSGKTSFLTTMIYSLITQYTPDEAHLYVLDFGTESLKAFQNAPHIGDVLLSYQEEKIKNLFKILSMELKERKKIFADYGGDILLFNTESEKKQPSIIIFIHNYIAFGESYPVLDEYIAYLSREGSKYGIYFVITVSSSTEVHFKLLQNFSQSIVLQMNDSSDYTAILGKNDGLVPTSVPGRGLIKVNEQVLEFQTAQISRNIKTYNDIKRNIESLKNEFTSQVKEIPVLPEKVNVHDLKKFVNLNNREIPIGINSETFEPCLYNFEKDYINYLVINGKSHLKNVKGILEMLNFYYKPIILSIDSISKMIAQNNFEDIISDLFDLVLFRNNTYKSSDNTEQIKKSFEHKIVVIYHLASLLDNLNDVLKEKLTLILEKGRSEYNINILIIEENYLLLQESYQTWFKTNVDNSHFIWLGHGINDQYIFNINDRCIFEKISNDFAVVSANGVVNKVKFISEGNDNNESFS